MILLPRDGPLPEQEERFCVCCQREGGECCELTGECCDCNDPDCRDCNPEEAKARACERKAAEAAAFGWYSDDIACPQADET